MAAAAPVHPAITSPCAYVPPCSIPPSCVPCPLLMSAPERSAVPAPLTGRLFCFPLPGHPLWNRPPSPLFFRSLSAPAKSGSLRLSISEVLSSENWLGTTSPPTEGYRTWVFQKLRQLVPGWNKISDLSTLVTKPVMPKLDGVLSTPGFHHRGTVCPHSPFFRQEYRDAARTPCLFSVNGLVD